MKTIITTCVALLITAFSAQTLAFDYGSMKNAHDHAKKHKLYDKNKNATSCKARVDCYARCKGDSKDSCYRQCKANHPC